MSPDMMSTTSSTSRVENASNARRARSTFASDTCRVWKQNRRCRGRLYPSGVCYSRHMSPPETRGYSASKDQLLGRLNRIEGQVGGVRRMVEEDRYCIDVLTQISAVRAALDKVALGLLDEHARNCVVQAEAG